MGELNTTGFELSLDCASDVGSDTTEAISDTDDVVGVLELVSNVSDPSCLELRVIASNSGDVGSDASEAIDNANCVIDVREFDSASLELRVVASNTEQRKVSLS